jgi:hypothetical protein
VIHVIDAVLLPPADEPAALPETGAESTSNPLLVLFAIGAGLVLGGFALRALRPAGMAGDTN